MSPVGRKRPLPHVMSPAGEEYPHGRERAEWTVRVEVVEQTTVDTDVIARSYTRGVTRYVSELDSPSLFNAIGSDGSGFADDPSHPSTDRLCPRALDNVADQGQLLADNVPPSRMITSGRLSPVILWGPPSCDRTMIA